MTHIRFPTLQDINACFNLDAHVNTEYVWQMRRVVEPHKISVTLQRVRLPRTMKLRYPPLGDSLMRHYEQRDALWVAVERGVVVGFVLIVPDGTTGVAWIRHLVVDRPQRRRGLGTALLERAVHAIAERGADRVVVAINAKNDPGIQFFLHHRFEISGYNEAHFGRGDIAMYLSRSLRRWF